MISSRKPSLERLEAEPHTPRNTPLFGVYLALELMGSTGKLESLLVLDGTLEALLGCRIGIVEASRLIAASRVTLCQESNPLFIPFVGIDSETDQFPLGEVRELWAPDALVRYDQERELAEQHFRSFAMQSANALLAWVRAQEF